MKRRRASVLPWNLRRGDVLDDGRVVANVTIVNGRAYVIMFNGPALNVDRTAGKVKITREVTS